MIAAKCVCECVRGGSINTEGEREDRRRSELTRATLLTAPRCIRPLCNRSNIQRDTFTLPIDRAALHLSHAPGVSAIGQMVEAASSTERRQLEVWSALTVRLFSLLQLQVLCRLFTSLPRRVLLSLSLSLALLLSRSLWSQTQQQCATVVQLNQAAKGA